MTALPAIIEEASPIVRTRGGAWFDPNQVRWVIREGHGAASINFERLMGVATPMFVHGFRKTLIWYAENKSLRHLDNMFQRAEHLFKHLNEGRLEPLHEISEVSLLNYHSSLGNQKWYLGSLAGFLKKWHALGYHGVTTPAITLLNELRLAGNIKGVAVLTMDPHNGPFTDIELESIQAALNNAYACGVVAKDDYLLAWLFMLLGQRPSQYALLKVSDVHAPKIKDGSRIHCLKVPRAKQRQAARLEFKERLLTPQIGELLYEYANEVEKSFEGKLEDPREGPLFPADSTGLQPAGMEYHQEADSLARKLVRALTKLEVFSERTGDLIHITATRFRRTLGTRAAREGHGELVIAELLDHTDTQNVGVYVQSTPEIVERIDKSVAMALAPLAQAFAGIVIADESAAIRGKDPSSRIFDPRIERSCQPMGSCGSHGFCKFSAPIACYTCQSFQAWLDGPHEAVLNHLLAERERKLTTTDMRIATINDRTILAVAEVIRQCEAHRETMELAAHG
ncbi:integrase/recombinase [Cupriavidus necator N-1]|uniref:Integrase/recombinase n=1 Tax=Cupriavidus necator (strain ATCC 43291 / DSM 13513 / CCUG 52238 / LMG 8453 / N-1) TaxID=1042878 RepID=G0EUS3_CUPNN|nr:site-specific integrase [Cupriavidus necator]AEI75784.1 integrase/recombinase [Cupriavidus necator N-1]MDX6012076.1 site-specific integrase [Cupriavidus necator]